MGVVGRLDQYASMLCNEFDDYSMSENLLTYSEQFDNASWTNSAVTITPNTINSPDGFATADKLIETATTAGHSIQKGSIAKSSNGILTFTVFAKSAERTWMGLVINDDVGGFGVGRYGAEFNLASGIASEHDPAQGTYSGGSYSITQYSNGWYRCRITCTTSTEGFCRVRIFVFQSSSQWTSASSYTGDGTSGIYIWGAQLETGSVATDYTPTTTTAINRVLASTTNTNITGLGTYYSSGFDENVGFTTFLSANVFAPYDPVYDEFGGTLFGPGQGRYMRQNTDKSVIVYNEIDEVTTIY